jgi:isopentenyldiphosphate isomerase
MPQFIPKQGQTDFTHIRRAPVINCVVRFERKILVVKRSSELNFYPNCWNGISGFLDDEKTIPEKVKEELREELGISDDHILSIKEAAMLEQEEPKYDKTWIVHPVLVEVDTDEVHLDWEGKEFAWVFPEEAKRYNLLPGFDRVLEAVMNI